MASAQHIDKKTKTKRVIQRTAAIAAGTLVALYGAGCIFFATHFFPNTELAGADVSWMGTAAAEETVTQAVEDRSIDVSGEGFSFTVTAEEMGISTNVDKAVERALGEQRFWAWPYEAFTSHSIVDAVRASFDTSKAQKLIDDAVAEHNKGAREPIDAFVYYDAATDSFQIDPGRPGTMIDSSALTATVVRALGSHQTTAYVTADDLVQRSVEQDSPKLADSVERANSFLGCDLALMVGDKEAARVNGNAVKGWITISSAGVVSLDRDLIDAWIAQLADKLDTVGDERKYDREDGKSVRVSGGSYGWICDREQLADIVYKAVSEATVGSVDVPFVQQAQVYAPGGRDFGKRYIDVDLTEQHVRFYGNDGSIIWESDCISGGTGGHETPTGTWFINAKMTNQVLVGLDENRDGEPDYRTPVNYWMPFEENMVAFHDALWQYSFGGTLYQQGYGSHGCINLPYDKTVELWNIVEIGDVVVVHY